jgi:hypothetical protein
VRRVEIKKISNRVFAVPSETREGLEHTVWLDPETKRWLCTCEGFFTILPEAPSVAILNLSRGGWD